MFRSTWKRGTMVSVGRRSCGLRQRPVLLCGPSVFPWLCKGARSLAWCPPPSSPPAGLADLCEGNAELDVGTERWEEF